MASSRFAAARETRIRGLLLRLIPSVAGVAPDDEMGNFDIAMDWAMGNFSVHQARSGSSIAALVQAHPHVCARSSWIRTPAPSSATTTRYAANCGCTRA